ncbi:MAG: DUF4340 domain-containing protein [Verrucomicrobia bacterium]|nr:DUF4340 domain-containing protein [Verrucomicrobiota bacterium]
MNRKQFIVLLVLVVVIGGIGLAVYNKNNASYQGSARAGQKLLGDFNVNDVSHVVIKQGANEVNLVKVGEIWTVKERGNYPANFEQISHFVRNAQELKVVQTMKVGASQRHRLELAEPGQPFAATVVELKGDGGKEIKSLWLGAKHMRKSQQPSPFGDDGGHADGRYVMVAPNSETVAVITDPLTTVEPRPASWLNKDFLKVEKVKSISVQSLEATNSWTVSREKENGPWSFADQTAEENFDTNKVSSLANALSYPNFTDVVVDKAPEQTGLDKPTLLTIDTLDGLKYAFSVGNKTPDAHYYVRISVSGDLTKERTAATDEKSEDKEKLDKEFQDKQQKLQDKLKQEQALAKWTYTMPSGSLDQLLKNRSELMVNPKDENETADADDDDLPSFGNAAFGSDLP